MSQASEEGKKSALLTLTANLQSLPKSELQHKAEGWLPNSEQERLSELLDFNRERTLTEAEAQELERLLTQVETIARESAAATWILEQNEEAS